MENFKQTRTELHTHFMGMLSAKGFIEFLSEYINGIPWPINVPIMDATEIKSVDNLENDEEFINAISIPRGGVKSYAELSNIYTARTRLINTIIRSVSEENNDQLKMTIYLDYFLKSIKELIDHGVKYTEISFSDFNIMKYIMDNIPSSIKDRINIHFLYGTDRNSKYNNKDFDMLTEMVSDDTILGYDFLGLETSLDYFEIKHTSDYLKDTGRYSYYAKFKLALQILTKDKTKYSVLRIHSGEAKGTEGNSEKIFHILEKIQNELGISNFPPPSLRIGHAIRYNPTEYYYDFLKRNNAIVEINISSNLAYGNIDNIEEIPILDYLKHDIPVVLSTDGHGAYNTSILIEDIIAFDALRLQTNQELASIAYEYIQKYDENIGRSL